LNIDSAQEIPPVERPSLATVLGLGLREAWYLELSLLPNYCPVRIYV
jgi:hypothetical protein